MLWIRRNIWSSFLCWERPLELQTAIFDGMRHYVSLVRTEVRRDNNDISSLKRPLIMVFISIISEL
jgi:hypothetical protein